MERMCAYLAHCALASLLGLWPGFAAAADRGLPIALPSSGVVSRAVPSLLQPMMASLQQRLTQLEAEARDTGAALNQPGSSAPAIVSARFPQLAALARQTAIEARAVRDQARVERQAHLENTADRIAADNDAISRGMEEARSKAHQATQAATVQLLAGVIGSAIQMKSAAVAMQGTLLQNTKPLQDAAPVITGGAAIGAATGGAASAATAAGAAAAGGAAPATGAGPAQGGAAGAAAAGAAAGGAYQGGAAAASGAGRLSIDQQVFTLQQQVQALQTQVAALQSVLKVTPTSATLQAPSISIFSSGDTLIQSSKGITVKAASGITVQSQAGTSIKAGSTATIEASGTTELKGAVIKLNGGSKPLATVGSQVQVPGQPIGQVLTGSGTILGN